MTTQGVVGNTVLLSSRQQSSKTTGTSSGAKDAFDHIMVQSLSAKKDTATSTANTEQTDVSRKTTRSKQSLSDAQNEVKKDGFSPGKESIKRGDTSTQAVTDDETNALTEADENITEDVTNMLSQMQEAILQTVAQVLSIPKEEVTSYLNELGMKPEDLLDTGNAMQLLMKVNQTDDVFAVLTDATLSEQLQGMNQALSVSELADSMGITEATLQKTLDLMAMSDDQKGQESLENPLQVPLSEDNQLLDEKEIPIVVERIGATNADQKSSLSEVNSTDSTEETIQTSSKSQTNEAQGFVTLSSKDSAKDTKDSKEGFSNQQEQAQNTGIHTFTENLVVKGQDGLVAEDVSARLETMRNIVEQVVEQIKVQIRPEATSMEITLNPENLGKINLSVTSKNGQLTATLTTQNELSKQALESQLQVLKENLSNQGLKVESVEVNVSDFAFDFGQNQQTPEDGKGQRGKGTKKAADLTRMEAMDLSENEEALTTDTSISNGGSVDYTV
ncbi:MAG: flagellar hook-length control protein FliK [Clostridiales bacterium]|nr:flagellar hook-length control protein FliK [Clostridiales bacterium]